MPTQVPGLSGVAKIAAGSVHSLALTSDGTVWGWGANQGGQLADGTFVAKFAPLRAAGIANVVDIAAGDARSYALKADGTVWAWGRDIDTKPRQIAPGYFRRIVGGASAFHLFLVDLEGRLWAYGSNDVGQLGLGYAPLNSTSTPQRLYDPRPAALNSVAVIEFANPTLGAGHYFITSDAIEAAAIDNGAAGPGWSRTGRGFRAWRSAAAAPPEASGVCRFYAAGPNSHFYTADPGECASLKAQNPTNDAALGWKFESIDFFAVRPSNGGCANGYQPVYRAYNNRFAVNDSNHRISTSAIDQHRSIRFLGYLDERVAFCSPIASIAGGDLHAYHVFPDGEVRAGDSLQVEYRFANNGPGSGNGARAAAIVPPAVADWKVACTATNGAVCPPLSLDALRSGFGIDVFPAGGTLTVVARGTAPQVAGAEAIDLRFGNTIQPPSGAPDTVPSNNLTNVTSTFVKNAGACSYGVPVTRAAYTSGGGASDITIATDAGCAIAATSDSPWLTATTANKLLIVHVAPNAGPTTRPGIITLQNRQIFVDQEGTASLPDASCVAGLTPSSAFLAFNATPGTIGLAASDGGCRWTASADMSWITITSGASGTGDGAITYRIEPFAGTTVRSGRIAVNDKTFTIVQHPPEDAKPVVDPGGGDTSGGSDGGGDGGGASSGGAAG